MSWDITNEETWTYKELPLGVKTHGSGISAQYETGGWRTTRPVWTEENCTNCMMCWVYCPDSSIMVKDQKMVGVNLQHCKGCGICVQACKFCALELVNEEDAKGVDSCHV